MGAPDFLKTEQERTLTVLKCRTPGEAYLVAEELEAADIIAVLPDEEALLAEFKASGCVNIRVSTQSYQAAKELQTVIETKHWDDRADVPLPVPLIITAFLLGLIPIPGFIFIVMINDGFKAKGYRRKAKSFPRWFLLGGTLFFVLLMIVAN